MWKKSQKGGYQQKLRTRKRRLFAKMIIVRSNRAAMTNLHEAKASKTKLSEPSQWKDNWTYRPQVVGYREAMERKTEKIIIAPKLKEGDISKAKKQSRQFHKHQQYSFSLPHPSSTLPPKTGRSVSKTALISTGRPAWTHPASPGNSKRGKVVLEDEKGGL